MGVKGKLNVQEYVYDFDVDGGVKDVNIELAAKDGKAVLPVGAIIMSVTAWVETAIEGTSSTVSWGITDNPDGYSGTTITEATLVANYIESGLRTANSIIFDDTNDVRLYPRVADAATGSFSLLISTADLTAGKIVFTVEYLLPGIDG